MRNTLGDTRGIERKFIDKDLYMNWTGLHFQMLVLEL